jgi:hypothetical protein
MCAEYANLMLKRMVYIVTTGKECLETVSEMPHFRSIHVHCKFITAWYNKQFRLQLHKMKLPHIGLERLEQYEWVHCAKTFVWKVGHSNYDVRGSVHHSTILTEKTQQDATAYQNFINRCFKWSSICFGWHTDYHQEPKTVRAAYGFAYVEGCRMCCCWMLSGSVSYMTTSSNSTPNNLPRMQIHRLLVQF